MPKATFDGWPGKKNQPMPASFLQYAPAVPGDWPVVPTNAQQALDELAAGGGGGGSPRREFIFEPSGVANPAQGVYNDWTTLVAAVVVEPTAATIEFRSDGSPGSVVPVPAGTWDFTAIQDLCFVGGIGSANVADTLVGIGLAAGCEIQVDGSLTLYAVNVGSFGAGGYIRPMGNVQIIRLADAANLIGFGLGPCVLAQGDTYILLEGASGIRGNGSPGGAVEVPLGVSLTVFAPSGSLEDNTLVGAGQATTAQGMFYPNFGGPVGTYGATQTGLATLNVLGVNPSELAQFVPIQNDWLATPPGNVQQALTSVNQFPGGNGNRYGFDFLDDFLAASPVGNLNWTLGSNGAGSGVVKDVSQTSERVQGIIDLRTGGSAGGRGFVRQDTAFVNPGAQGELVYESLLQIPVVSTAGDNFFVNMGFTNNTSGGQGTNSIAFRYDNGNWIAFSRAGGVETAAVDTGIAIVAGQWVKLRIQITPSGAYFYIAQNLGTNYGATPDAVIPQAALPNATQLFHPIAMIQKQVGNGLRRFFVDYIRYALLLNAPR